MASESLHLPRLQAVTLARLVLGFVALAAVAGWAASFVGLHGFALTEMHGYGPLTAWLVPGSFDGAAFACSVLVYRASIFGRSALRGRVLMYGFTLLSGWINWHFQTNSLGQWVASALPFAAVLVFDTVLSDLRAEWETRHGRQAFRLRLGLLALRWAVDRAGTASAFRAAITAVPVTDLVGLGNLTPGASATGPEPSRTVQDRPVPLAYTGPVPPFTSTTGTEDWVPVPPVTEPQPAERYSGASAAHRTGGNGPVPLDLQPPARPSTQLQRELAPPRTVPVPAERHPETDSERTMLIPRVKVDQGPDPRAKVDQAATARRLVSVPVELDSSASNEALAHAVAEAGGMSRRAVMTRFQVGSARATKIVQLAKGVSHGPQASAR